MKNKHVCLIFTPIDKKYRDAQTHFAPPLGLVALENSLRVSDPEIKTTILGGSVVSNQEEIHTFIEREKPDVVGQSVQLISYENALDIARTAKSVGAVNILGGHHASQLTENIIRSQHAIIDCVAIGDGEKALSSLVRGISFERIKNLVHFSDGKVVSTKREAIDLCSLPVVSYSEIDLLPYQKLLQQADFAVNQDSGATNYLRVYSHKGCGNRGSSTGCVFCGRCDVGVRFKTPQQFWDDVSSVVEISGADYIFDVGDDFLYDDSWVSAVASIKPDIKGPYEMGIFGRANRISVENARFLKQIGVTDIVIGFESGDENVLRLCNKKDTTPETNLRAAQYFFMAGIDICASFVVGLPGENEASLLKTYECVAKIVSLAKEYLGRLPREMVANLLEPSPGSPAYFRILKDMPDKYKGKDVLSLEDLQRDYFRCFFGLNLLRDYECFRDKLRATAKAIHQLGSIR